MSRIKQISSDISAKKSKTLTMKEKAGIVCQKILESEILPELTVKNYDFNFNIPLPDTSFLLDNNIILLLDEFPYIKLSNNERNSISSIKYYHEFYEKLHIIMEDAISELQSIMLLYDMGTDEDPDTRQEHEARLYILLLWQEKCIVLLNASNTLLLLKSKNTVGVSPEPVSVPIAPTTSTETNITTDEPARPIRLCIGNEITLLSTSATSATSTVVIPTQEQNEWAKAAERVKLCTNFKYQIGMGGNEYKFEPHLDTFDVEEFLYHYNKFLKSQALNNKQKVLAFFNTLAATDRTTAHQKISDYLTEDADRCVFRSWSAIETYLVDKFTYPCVNNNTNNIWVGFRTFNWKTYLANSTLDAFVEHYNRFAHRMNIDVSTPAINLCHNFLDVLPQLLKNKLADYLMPRTDGSQISYLLADFQAVAIQKYALLKRTGELTSTQIATIPTLPTTSNSLKRKGGHSDNNHRDNKPRGNTSSKTPRTEPTIFCEWHWLKKGFKTDKHTTADCYNNKKDPLSQADILAQVKAVPQKNAAAVALQTLKRMQTSLDDAKKVYDDVVNSNVNKFANSSPPKSLVYPIFNKSDDVYPTTVVHPVSGLGIIVDTLFDTGCTCNVISQQLVDIYKFPYRKEAVNCSAIDGSPIPCLGYTTCITLILGEKSIISKFLIISDQADGSVPLITIGRPSFNSLGVDVKFPISPSTNLRYSKNPGNIATSNINSKESPARLFQTSSSKHCPDKCTSHTAIKKKHKSMKSSISKTRQTTEDEKTFKTKVATSIKLGKNSNYACSLKRVGSIPPVSSSLLGNIQAGANLELGKIIEVPIAIGTGLDINHVLDLPDSQGDMNARNKMLSFLEGLLKLNNEATISTAEKPCFIDSPSAKDIKIQHLDGTEPVYTRQYSIPTHCMESGDEHMFKMLETGKYELYPHGIPFPYNIPVLISITLGPDLITVKKIRFCHDLRALNVNLKNDTYPLPTSDEIFSKCLGDLFTELDCETAFYQMCVRAEDRNKLAFMWRGKRYRCVGVPFGLSFVSSTFQRVMDEVFPPEEFPFLLKFIDNLIIATDGLSHEEHAAKVALVIERATKCKVRLSIKKCVLMKRTMETLGMQISNSTVSLAPTKKKAIENWSIPTSWPELEHVIGFALFLRKFVYKFSDVIKPLYDLNSIGRNKVNGRAPKFKITDEAIAAFKLLKERLASPITLHHYDSTKPLCVATDASKIAMCIVLYQPSADEGPTAENIVDFYTRSFKGYECNYPPFKLEALALHDGLMHFADILYQRKFKVYTDQKALTYMFNSINTNRTLANWLFDLLHFDFEIYHIAGTLNVAPDHGSRIPSVTQDVETFQAFLEKMTTGKNVGTLRDVIRKEFEDPSSTVVADIDLTKINLRRLKTMDCEEDQIRLIETIHSQGHFGISAIRNRIESLGHYWPKLIDQVKAVVGSCESCQFWTYERKRAFHPLRGIHTRWPFDHLQMDLITSFKANDRYKYLLVVVDVFTSYTFLRPLTDKKTETIAAALFAIFTDFGTPLVLQNDNEPAMVGKVLTQLKKIMGIESRLITPYVSHSNGKVENTIRTVSEVVHKLLFDLGTDAWSVVPMTQMFINHKVMDVLKISKFALLFNRENNLFTKDSILNSKPSQDLNLDDPIFMETWKKHLESVNTELLPIMRKAMEVQQWKYLAQFTNTHSVDMEPLAIDTIVMLRDVTRTEKDHPPYVGNFTIKAVNENQRYEILNNLTGEMHHYPVDRLNLKPLAHAIPNSKLGGRLAFVDYIISDRINESGQKEYLVRWTGQNANQDSFVLASAISDPALITDFNKSKIPASKQKEKSEVLITEPVKKKQKKSRNVKQPVVPVPMRPAFSKRKRTAKMIHHLDSVSH